MGTKTLRGSGDPQHKQREKGISKGYVGTHNI